MWLTGTMVCLQAALRVSLMRAMGGRIMRCRIIIIIIFLFYFYFFWPRTPYALLLLLL